MVCSIRVEHCQTSSSPALRSQPGSAAARSIPANWTSPLAALATFKRRIRPGGAGTNRYMLTSISLTGHQPTGADPGPELGQNHPELGIAQVLARVGEPDGVFDAVWIGVL